MMRSWAEISRAQLAANFRAIQAVVGPDTIVAPVVKANAYGHGAVEVSRVLVGEGAQWLAVNCTGEGVELRDAGLGCRILVMGGVLPFEREAAFRAGLTVVVHSIEELRELDAAGVACAVHLMLDTGMTRLGSTADAAAVVNAMLGLKTVRVEGLMSHFASAERFDSGQTGEQIARFGVILQAVHASGLSPAILHFSSTNGVAYGWRGAWLSLVRPGIAIYGYVPPGCGEMPACAVAVSPVLTWRARIVGIQDVAAGTLIGYGGRFEAPRPMRVGVIAAGYADGVPKQLSNRGQVVAGGRLAAILGAVSMDLTTIDLSASPGLHLGDAVTLIGREGEAVIDAQTIADVAGEIAYSVLCGIGNRVGRVYV